MQLESFERAVDHGTLLWIGDRDAIAWRDAYRYCDEHVSQLAYRKDLTESLARPATDVRAVILCRQNDSICGVADFHSLRQLHADSQTMLLLGPLCAGSRPSPQVAFDSPALWWHNWESTLPEKLRRCGVTRGVSDCPSSVVVFADCHASASALLSIASIGDSTAVWCRPEQGGSVRGFDEAWWDDSATRKGSWPERIKLAGSVARNHIWITNDLTPGRREDAMDAGVSQVIAKPGDFSQLIRRARHQGGDRRSQAA